MERGIVFAKEKDFTLALECYKQALERCPSNIDAMVAAGAAKANQEDFEAALKYFDDALGTGTPLSIPYYLCVEFFRTAQPTCKIRVPALLEQTSSYKMHGPFSGTSGRSNFPSRFKMVISSL